MIDLRMVADDRGNLQLQYRKRDISVDVAGNLCDGGDWLEWKSVPVVYDLSQLVDMVEVFDADIAKAVEQSKPEPKFAVGQRVRIIGPKERPAEHWEGSMDEHVNTTAEVVAVSCMVGEKVFYNLRLIEQWAFRADYLEPVVEPEPKHYTLRVGDTISTPSGHRIKVTEHGVEVQ